MREGRCGGTGGGRGGSGRLGFAAGDAAVETAQRTGDARYEAAEGLGVRPAAVGATAGVTSRTSAAS